jgi:hypothetical protein
MNLDFKSLAIDPQRESIMSEKRAFKSKQFETKKINQD